MPPHNIPPNERIDLPNNAKNSSCLTPAPWTNLARARKMLPSPFLMRILFELGHSVLIFHLQSSVWYDLGSADGDVVEKCPDVIFFHFLDGLAPDTPSIVW